MKIPYSEFELKMELLRMDEDEIGSMIEKFSEKIDSDEKLSRIFDNDKKTDNICEYHGITKDSLINSPNYDKLVKAFVDYSFALFRDVLVNLGLTEKQAYVIIAIKAGLINLDGQ